MRGFLCAPFAVFLLVVQSPPTQAQQNDPCGFVEQITIKKDNEDSLVRSFKTAVRTITDWFSREAPYIKKLSDAEAGLYFIRRPAYSFIINCREPDRSITRLLKSIRYGVGLVVEATHERRFSRATSFGGKVTERYFFVRTQHGLQAFIRRNDLRRLNPDSVYFFEGTGSKTPVCTAPDKCGTGGRELTARAVFGRMTRKDFLAERTGPGECGTFTAATYNAAVAGGATAAALRPEYKKVSIKTCHTGVRLVDPVDQVRRFATIVPDAGYMHVAAAKLSRAIPFLVTYKGCGPPEKTIRAKFSATLGGSIGADFGLLSQLMTGAAAEFNAGASAEGSVEDVWVYKAAEQHIFGSYYVSLPWVQATDRAVRDTYEFGGCIGKTPDRPQALTIYTAHLGSQAIDIVPKQLTESMRSDPNVKGGQVWPRVVQAKNYREGRIWSIGSIEQYEKWARYLGVYIANRIPLDPVDMKSEEDLNRLKAVIDFYTHLILTIAFDFTDEQESRKLIALLGQKSMR